MSNEIKKYSKDGLCGFDPKWNSFIYTGGRRLRSWSKIIKQHTEQVDSAELARKYAEKHGGTAEAWLADWELKGALSRATGTQVHELFDDYFTHGVLPHGNTTVRQDVAMKFITDFFETGRLKCLESELISYDADLDVATLVDCVVEDRASRRYIIDWKTDSVIKDNAYGRKMLGPLSHLPDHPLMQHKVQLNFCRELLPGMQIDGLYIGHINDNGYTLIPVENLNINMKELCIPKKPEPPSLPF